MASPNTLTAFFEAFKGLDLRSSDILRDKAAATELKNMQYRNTGAMSKRKGWKFLSKANGGYGLTTFNNVNVSTGAITEETITIDDDLHKIVNNTFTIAYSGSDSATYDMYLDATLSKYYFKIKEGGTTLLNYDLGTGLEGSPVTITTLVAAITALTDFTSGTITNSAGSDPAAFAIQSTGTAVTSGGTLVPFRTITAISAAGSFTTPFSTFYGQRTDSNFENATFAQVNDVLYIATGHDPLFKYDGNRVYKAGLPKATTPTLNAITTPGSGTFTGVNDVRYKIETQYTDAKSNIIYSEISDKLIVTTMALTTNNIVIDFTNLAASSGYDTDGSLVYNIFRTDDSADATDVSLYYLVGTASQDTTQFTDTGITEGLQYVEPIKQRGLPPQGRYIDVWRDQLIISGIATDVTKTAYSDLDNAEYFPTSDNAFKVSRKVTGIKSMNNVLYVFQDRTIDGVTGSLGEDQFQVDNLSREGIGCSAHHTISEVNGQLFFLSNRGVRAINPKGIQDIGFAIYPKFTTSSPFTFKQAIGYHHEREEKYILFMPSLPVDPSYSDDDGNEIYAYDTARKAWLVWDNLNFHGGITETDGELLFNRRILSNVNMCRLHSNNDKRDYADATDAISFVYKSHWSHMGQPSVYKKFLRIKVHSYDVTVGTFEGDSFNLTVKTENDFIIKTLTNVNLDFSAGALGWGISPYGVTAWGETRLAQLRSKLASKKAKSMRVIFENSAIHENVLISGYEVDISSAYKQRLKA